MGHARYLVGDVRERLAELKNNSVDLVMTSPPFLALRSYLPADHPDKGKEIGSEPDPGTFIDTMCQLVDDLSRVLAPHGSMVFEFGDTYAGSGGGGGDYMENGLREGQPGFGGSAERQREGNAAHWRQKNQAGSVWPRAKSLALVPELFRITLAYGTNPLTGRVWWEGNDRWLVRNVVRWVRPNPPVGALRDKFRPATSDLVVFTRSSGRWFDLDAVRTAHKYGDYAPKIGDNRASLTRGTGGDNNAVGKEIKPNPAGAPPLDWWNITTSGYPGSHYAVYPPELCVIPIKSMCPERVCRRCGEPSRRITERTPEYAAFCDRKNQGERTPTGHTDNVGNRDTGWDHGDDAGARGEKHRTVGWSDCGHDDWRPGLTLDPFAGSGTTLAVATGHGRDAIGIDLDERNATLAVDRVGPMFLSVVDKDTRFTYDVH